MQENGYLTGYKRHDKHMSNLTFYKALLCTNQYISRFFVENLAIQQVVLEHPPGLSQEAKGHLRDHSHHTGPGRAYGHLDLVLVSQYATMTTQGQGPKGQLGVGR